jgi:hypothetical protein
MCQPGDQLASCGQQGLACSVCSFGQLCSSNRCSFSNPGSGGGTAGGGSAVSGGGIASGGGVAVDSGMSDSGINDAGINDAGINDAGINDAGPIADAGVTVNEVEPNDTRQFADDAGILIDSTVTTVKGTLGPAEADFYRLVMENAGLIRVIAPSNAACPLNFKVSFVDQAGTELAAGVQTAGTCKILTKILPAGNYYLNVSRTSVATAPSAYTLALSLPSVTGAEAEPNGTILMPNAIPPLGLSVITGSLATVGDIDVYSFTTSRPVRLLAETIEAGTLTCEPDAMGMDLMDTVIEVVSSAGLVVTDDDSSGRGECSLVDDAVSGMLPVGTYFIRVKNFTPATKASGPYHLLVNIAAL